LALFDQALTLFGVSSTCLTCLSEWKLTYFLPPLLDRLDQGAGGGRIEKRVRTDLQHHK
jgi:hypothetical protein